MKKLIGYVIVLVIIGAVGYVLFPKAPDLVGVKPTEAPSLTKKIIVLKADAQFDNKNYFGLTLVGHDIDVFVGDKKVGNVSQTMERKIPAREKFNVPVKVTFNRNEVLGGAGFFKNALKFALNNDLIITYKGTVDVNVLGIGIPVPVDYSQKLVDFSFNNPVEEE